MRRLCRWLLLLCGTALICLRLYPFDETEWVSTLFQDDLVYAQANAFSLRLIRESGLSMKLYASYVSNLTTLTHTVVMLLEAVTIALVFLIASRKVQ